MVTHCQNCKIMSEYKYRNELPAIKHSFLKQMEGRFHLRIAIPKQSNDYFKGVLEWWCILEGPSGNGWRVKVIRDQTNVFFCDGWVNFVQDPGLIPKQFKDGFKRVLEGWCILQGPSGNGWRVKVIRDQTNIFFSDGWVNFVQDHGLMLGDSCVFSYLGASTFEVMIFKQSGLEREGTHFTRNSSSFPSPITCLNSHAHQSNFCEDMEDGSNDHSSSLGTSGEVQISGKGKAPKSTEEDDKSYEVEDEDGTSCKKRGRPSSSQGTKCQTVYISRRREVTKGEIEATRCFATAYVIHNNDPHIPRIQITMLRSHVYQGFHLTIKKEWALEHMCLEDHELKLRVQGQEGKWIIGCRWTPRRQCQLRVNWPAFVLDNNLEEHDVCVFEILQKGNLREKIKPVFNVHIFRVVHEIVPLRKIRVCLIS